MRSGLNGGWISRPSPRRLWQCTGLAWLACALATAGMAPATAATETVIHNFGTFPNGANPYGTVIRDAAGNLYGTTYQGGAHNLGTVFELEASGKLKLLYSFQGGGDGANPYAGVTRDAAGNLYGTTYYGGAANAGVVYKLEPSGQEMVLYAFTGGPDGGSPYAGVVLDAAGNLYGTTYLGGMYARTTNLGVVYKDQLHGAARVSVGISVGDTVEEIEICGAKAAEGSGTGIELNPVCREVGAGGEALIEVGSRGIGAHTLAQQLRPCRNWEQE
ncbi:MAG: choice-of-anchor tandem repeat GloVer-containing protein [Bryobacteraceae bacterium]|jgi:uncharacterized repeat protein (TIGR03803 family)